MSAAVEERVVEDPIVLCDICGLKIEEPDDPDMVGSLIGYSVAHEPADQQATPKMRLRWPSFAFSEKRRKEYETAKTPYAEREVITRVEYDFHGDCVVNLVQAAIALRTSKPTVNEGYKIHTTEEN
jgi:hypothetical protein